MSPFEQVVTMYREKPVRGDLPFELYLEQYLCEYHVISTPDFFVMFRPVVRHAAPAWIKDSFRPFHPLGCDCWYVFALAGDIGKAVAAMPWFLPWLAWERELGGTLELRFYRTEAIKRMSLPRPCATTSSPSPTP